MKNREGWQEVKLGEIAEIVGGFAFKSNHFSKPAISKHLKNIYKTAELEKGSTVSILETVQKEGNRKITRKIEYYNLDAILSVGYRVNSKQATRFRIWATKTLKQHLLHGYTINKKRIAKNHEKFMQAVADMLKLHIDHSFILRPLSHIFLSLCIFAACPSKKTIHPEKEADLPDRRYKALEYSLQGLR